MLPSQANLTEAQWRELLTYHRAKGKRENICPKCKELWKEAERTCYFCQRTYTEEHGVVYDEDAGSLKGWVDGKDLTDEEKAQRIEALTKKMKSEGKLMLPGPISREEAKAMMAKLKERNSDG